MSFKLWIAEIMKEGMCCDICKHKFNVKDKCWLDARKGLTLCNACNDKREKESG